MVISSNQLSINIRTRGSWGTNGHLLGIVCYIEGASSYKWYSVALKYVTALLTFLFLSLKKRVLPGGVDDKA